MSLTVNERQKTIIQDIIIESVQAQETSQVARFYCYEPAGYFVAPMFSHFVKKVSDLALEKIKQKLKLENCYEESQLPEIEKITTCLLDEKLRETYEIISPYESVRRGSVPNGGITWDILLGIINFISNFFKSPRD